MIGVFVSLIQVEGDDSSHRIFLAWRLDHGIFQEMNRNSPAERTLSLSIFFTGYFGYIRLGFIGLECEHFYASLEFCQCWFCHWHS